MSRARTPPSPLESLCAAGRLAAIDIGLETIVLPAAQAHKLLPLLEKAATADGAFSGYMGRNKVHLREMVRPAYRLLAEGTVVVGPRPSGSDEAVE